ncbi:MAG: ribosome biogenesis GTPase YlqF [Christensenella sp.]|uniref:ribosome biogenesis GTPase YlqF n=1 Tax=Christensenella sp. TaxID=1935934 RepID=UPI002B1F551C|nr:ribosome biogenesis GTPase YlqF [Christensenella sp.]MEA5003077.1 ribosome biogenesis GTPase YlqF [Christensenella sp.]
MDIQWYPGHMTKARRQLKDKLKMIDMVIEVLDARAPKSSLNPDFDDMFSQKTRFYILNKADLADENITKNWIAFFEKQGIRAVAFSATKGNTQQLKKSILDCAQDILKKYKDRGMNKTLRCMVAGIPNVGKSAILNRLSGGKKMLEGNKPGVTRSLQWAKVDDYLEIMDTPGLLWPKFKDEDTGAVVALIGSVKLDILDEEALAFHLISLLKVSAPKMLTERYKLEDLDKDSYEILCDICKSRGFLLKGGVFDTERGAKTLLDEFKNGKMGRISLEKPERA